MRESPLGETRARIAIAIGLAGLLGLAALFAFLDLETARSGAFAAWSQLKSAPAPVYFAVVAVALFTPVPASFLFITAGPLYGIVPSLLWIAPTLALNTLGVHVIASSWLRPPLERFVARRDFTIPRLETRADQRLFITLIRITPGIPYFVQSWLIGLAGVERVPFIVITVLVQMVYATGFVVLGYSAFEGELALAIGAGVLLVFISVGARLIHRRFRAARAASSEATPDPE